MTREDFDTLCEVIVYEQGFILTKEELDGMWEIVKGAREREDTDKEWESPEVIREPSNISVGGGERLNLDLSMSFGNNDIMEEGQNRFLEGLRNRAPLYAGVHLGFPDHWNEASFHLFGGRLKLDKADMKINNGKIHFGKNLIFGPAKAKVLIEYIALWDSPAFGKMFLPLGVGKARIEKGELFGKRTDWEIVDETT